MRTFNRLRFVTLGRSQVLSPGDDLTVHADLRVDNNIGAPVTMIGFRWEPVYAELPPEPPAASDELLEVTR